MKLSIILTILLLPSQETLVPSEQPATAPVAAANSAAATESGTVIATDTGDAAQPAAQTWTMRYQFHPGQQLRYQSKQQMTLEAQVGENQRVDVSQVRQVRRYAVSETTGDLSRLSMQFEDVWMHRQVDQEPPVEFRSSMKPSEVPEVFRNVAHSLRGAAPIFQITSVGRAVAPQAEPAKAQKTVASPVDSATEVKSGEKSVAAVSPRSGEADPGSFLMLLPETPVSEGGTWKEEFQVQVRGGQDLQLPVQILRTYRLESVENGIAKVTFRSSVRTPLRSTVVRSQLIQATPSGSFLLDLKRGLMVRREFRWNETVIGALGPESILASHGNQTDELLEEAVEPVAN